MEQQPTNKEKLINRLLGIIKGELPAERFGLCICWDEDPESPEPDDLNVFMVDGRKVTYQEWKKYFGNLNTKIDEQERNS